MPTDDEQYRERLAALTKAFADGFGARMSGIEQAYAEIGDAGAFAEKSASVRSLLEHAHKIAGSAGTFGFADISAVAAQIEKLCDRILSNKHGTDSDAREALRRGLESLRALAPK